MSQQQKQHYSASELAGLPGLPTTTQKVTSRAKREGWPFRARSGRGGGREYPLTAIPQEAQSAIAARDLRVGNADLRVTHADATAQIKSKDDTLAHLFEAKPDSLKAKARERLAIVQEYHALLGRGFQRTSVVAAVTSERSVSVATLMRYLALTKGEPAHLWLYLLTDRYTGRTATAEMSAAAWEYLKADYLRPERPTASTCIYRLKRAAATHGWTIPSHRTLLRRLENLPRATKVLAREGKKALLQLYPAQARSRAALAALDLINGDGYMHNVWVAFPDGEVRRVKTWFWQDVFSSKVIAWRTDKTEHTDMIRLSFGDVVEHYGIPNGVLLDNTRAAANKTMSGGIKHRFRFKVKEEEPLGIFPLLNVTVHWATPGHGQAKPVERVFGVGGMGELIDKAPELAGAWTGASSIDKPEYDGKSRTVPIAQLEAVIAREIEAFNARDGRRSPVHQGRSFDAVFNESYARSAIRRAPEAQRRLWLLATEPVRANSKDGAITLDAGRIARTDVAPMQANRYWSNALVDYAGQMVVARFDPKRLHEGVHVYTPQGRYITFADCFAPQGFTDQNAAREHQRNRKTFMRAEKDLLNASRRMTALEASKFLPGADVCAPAPSIPAPKVTRAQFREPLERAPLEERPMDAETRAFMDQAEQPAPMVNVHALRGDTEKDSHWRAIDARRAAGETLAESDEQFWQAWQKSSYFRIQRELDAEFDERIAARA